jgi:hypothetical protein
VNFVASWRENTGRDDVPTREILMALNSWQKSLAPSVSLVIVTDTELSTFHADLFPSGIAIRNGVILSNIVLSSRGSERMLLQALTDQTKVP